MRGDDLREVAVDVEDARRAEVVALLLACADLGRDALVDAVRHPRAQQPAVAAEERREDLAKRERRARTGGGGGE